MKVKELIELLGKLDPENDITLAIAVKGNDDIIYQDYACCEHFIVHKGCDESELIGLELDLWKNERYRNIFCKSYNYPQNKFKE